MSPTDIWKNLYESIMPPPKKNMEKFHLELVKMPLTMIESWSDVWSGVLPIHPLRQWYIICVSLKATNGGLNANYYTSSWPPAVALTICTELSYL